MVYGHFDAQVAVLLTKYQVGFLIFLALVWNWAVSFGLGGVVWVLGISWFVPH